MFNIAVNRIVFLSVATLLLTISCGKQSDVLVDIDATVEAKVSQALIEQLNTPTPIPPTATPIPPTATATPWELSAQETEECKKHGVDIIEKIDDLTFVYPCAEMHMIGTPTPSAQDRAAESAAKPVDSSIPTATPIPMPTSTPTSTPIPTSTPTVTPVPPLSTPTPTATPIPTATAVPKPFLESFAGGGNIGVMIGNLVHQMRWDFTNNSGQSVYVLLAEMYDDSGYLSTSLDKSWFLENYGDTELRSNNWTNESFGILSDFPWPPSFDQVTNYIFVWKFRVETSEEFTCTFDWNGYASCVWDEVVPTPISTPTPIPTPTPTPVPPTKYVDIGAGKTHTCAATEDLSVFCWGADNYGQLGNGNIYPSIGEPIEVKELISGVTSISLPSSGAHSCALTNTGGVTCWGFNSNYELGTHVYGHQSYPAQINIFGIKSIAAGSHHTCALPHGGTVRCWGANGSGQLGIDTWINDGYVKDQNDNELTQITAITSGEKHACALSQDGKVSCWGDNQFGQLGDGTNIQKDRAIKVSLPSDVQSISAGEKHTCAVVGNTGNVYCWGNNEYGQLGLGFTGANRLEPVLLSGLTSAADISAGSLHTCVIVQGGAVKCWGENINGQLGDGNTTLSSTPVDVVDLPSEVTDISAGGWHTCALTSDGRALCWGDNDWGQLGNGTFDDQTEPQEVW